MRVELRSLPNYVADKQMIVRLTGNEFIYIHAIAGKNFPGFRISMKLSRAVYLVMPNPGGPFTPDHVFNTLLKHFASQVQYFGKAYLVDEKKRQAATGDSDYWKPGAFETYRGSKVSKAEARRQMRESDLPIAEREQEAT